MVTNDTYRLCGYVEYIASSVGFVTPVFENRAGGYYIQVSGENRQQEWELLPEIYHALLTLDTALCKNIPADSFVYGFKWNDHLIFAEGRRMATYLSESFLPKAKEGGSLAQSFLMDWASLEPVEEPLTKESIWKRCINFIASQSNAMPEIFGKNFEVLEFKNAVLTLQSTNTDVKKVFEKQYREQLIAHFQENGLSLDIQFKKEADPLFPRLPFVYFGGGEAVLSQGSHIMQTSINEYQDFDNFIVSGFNEKAYKKALDFTESAINPFITIRGNAGTGKSHIVNSIARRLSGIDQHKKVGVYTVFTQPGSSPSVSEAEIDQFEFEASGNDVIILDNADSIGKGNVAMQRMVKVLKRWRESGKKVVVSYRDNFDIDIIPATTKDFERLILDELTKNDKLTIIESKTRLHNIKLSHTDAVQLAADSGIKNFWDIQKSLVRKSVLEDIKLVSSLRFNWHDTYHRDLKWLESPVISHNRLPILLPFAMQVHNPDLYTGMISHFINDIFQAPHHGSIVTGQHLFHGSDALFFSIDHLHYYYFENQEFRKLITGILLDNITKYGNK